MIEGKNGSILPYADESARNHSCSMEHRLIYSPHYVLATESLVDVWKHSRAGRDSRLC